MSWHSLTCQGMLVLYYYTLNWVRIRLGGVIDVMGELGFMCAWVKWEEGVKEGAGNSKGN